MNKQILTITFIIWILAYQGYTQIEWSLEDCIIYANNNNLTNKGNEYSSETSKENFQQSKRDFLPNINGFSRYNMGYGRFIDLNTNDIINTKSYSNGYSLETSINLFNSFRQWNNASQQRFLYESTKASELQARYELAFQVMDAFYTVKFKEGLLNVAEERKELSVLNYKVIVSKVNLGLMAKSDLYDIESTLAADELKVTQAHNQLEESILNLMQIMNINGPFIKLKKETDHLSQSKVTISQDVNITFNKTLEFLPSIKQQELMLSASEKGLSIIKSNLYPSIRMSAGISSGVYQTQLDVNGNTVPFFDQIIDNNHKYIGVSLRIPISNKWSIRSNIKKSKIQIEQTKNDLEEKKQEVYKEIQRILQKNEALLDEKHANELNLKARELSYNIAQKKFAKGILTIYDLQQSKNQFSMAQINEIRIGIQLKYQKKTIDFYNGIQVFQFD